MLFTAETPLEPQGNSLFKAYTETVPSSFLKRMVQHRRRHVADVEGDVTLSPAFHEDY